MKKYIDYMNEISNDELYKALLGYGLFADKLPPVFSSEAFYNYCINNNPTFAGNGRQYVYYESMRNINIPRPLGIPVPMVYEKLCKCLSDNWDDIKQYFYKKTNKQEYKISRIHIRKMYNRNEIFEMNYNDWREDGSPENKLIYGMKYVVHADISKCFQSIYTHSLSWALVGKSVAKQTKNQKKLWYNVLDHMTQINKDLETHGLIIGPHVSNVLSEIILCAVDEKLEKKWKFIRNIDDYICYVKTEEDAEKFLVDLQEALREYDLSLNHKKTQIDKLPNVMSQHWIRKINAISLLTSYNKVNYINCRTYIDYAIEISEKEKGNASVLKYAIKTLSGQELTENAKKYEKDMVFHLCVLYPYLVTLLDTYVFEKCDVAKEEIQKLSNTLYEQGISKQLYEQASYALYFSLKYDFELPISSETLINSQDCILLAMGYLYFKKKNNILEIDELKKYAKSLLGIQEDFDKMWLFAYEILNQADLKDEWKTIKKAGVSFIRSEYYN